LQVDSIIWSGGATLAYVERGVALRPPAVGHDRENMAKQLDRETEQNVKFETVVLIICALSGAVANGNSTIGAG